jgi:hypothetical protein
MSIAKFLCVSITAVLFAGCQSLGDQYISPSSTQPNATFQTGYDVTYLISHNEKGCFSGRTKIKIGDNFLLEPEKEVDVQYQGQWAPSREAYPIDDSFCTFEFGFVPEEGAHYSFAVSRVQAVRGKNLGYCVPHLNKIAADGVNVAVEIRKSNYVCKR